MKPHSRLLLAGMLALGVPVGAAAEDLQIGTRATPTLDPHFLYLGTNLAFAEHIYGRLVERDASGHYLPGLATSWELVNPTRWRFHLRQGVTYQDGSPFTAADVVFSFRRVSSLPNNPAPYTSYLNSIVSIDATDDHTVDIVTDRPNPVIPLQVNGISILSQRVDAGKMPADFANGKAAIGTGPYRVVENIQGDRLVLQRFDGYVGPKPAWDHVTFRIMPNDAGRVAALRSGDVDLIDAVAPTDAISLSKLSGLALHRAVSSFVLYLGATIDLAQSPAVTDATGQPLKHNPLTDTRVRRAVSLAINRAAITERLMGGFAQPASQLAMQGMVGYASDRGPDPFDPAESHALLSEAGVPAGFATTLSCPNDRYLDDAAICQAVGQMLARIGIRVSVDTEPASVYFSRLRTPHNPLPLFLLGWGNFTGDATTTLVNVLESYDRAKQTGANNRTGFSDPEVDALIDAAVVELDQAKRAQLMAKATGLAAQRYAVIPLVQPVVVWASKSTIAYQPSDDEETIAMRASPARP